jgi:hypothetical protein
MNANSLARNWSTLCPPAQIYPIVLSALVLFDLYRGSFKQAISHIVAMLIGTTFLWILCAANLEFAAYSLLILPLVFFVFLLAIIFYDQSLLSIKHEKKRRCDDECDGEESCCEGSK